MVCKVLYFDPEVRSFKGKDGVELSGYDVSLAREATNGHGWLPCFLKVATNATTGNQEIRTRKWVSVKAFGGELLKAGDIVDVDVNEFGSISAIRKRK